jgi:hypothetical protein
VKVCGWHMANWSEDAGEVPWRDCETEQGREGAGSAPPRGSTTRIYCSSHSAGQTQLVLQQPRARRPGHHLTSSQDWPAHCFMKARNRPRNPFPRFQRRQFGSNSSAINQWRFGRQARCALTTSHPAMSTHGAGRSGE